MESHVPEAAGGKGTAALAGGAAADGGTSTWPSPARAWYCLGIFALALTINFLYRGILNLLIEPIKHDLGLTDVQMDHALTGLLGLATAMARSQVGLVRARAATDRDDNQWWQQVGPAWSQYR